MTKYQQVISEMFEYNKDLFDSFRKIHDAFGSEPQNNRELFNQEGEKVLRVIRRYENILCGKSESGRYGKFSTNLSEKFWTEVRSHFPHIDSVGALS